MNIPKVSRIRSFSESLRMKSNPILIFSKHQKILGNTYYYHLGGVKKALITSSPVIIEHVLQKNYKNYSKSEIQKKKMGHFLGDGLLTSHGAYWITQRRIIQEGFKKDKLKSYIQTMDRIVLDTMEKIKAEARLRPIDLNKYLRQVTFEMVMGTLYSDSLSEVELNKIGNTISTIQKFILKQIVQPYLNFWYKFTGELERHEKQRESADKIIFDVIQKRNQSSNNYSDLLQTLIDARYKETGLGMTEKQILMESMQLIVAGHETSSTALSWTIYLLMQNQEAFKIVRQEMEALNENELPDLEDLSKFEYTMQVIDEALRLYPPFWMLDRESIEDDEIEGYKIPKGTMVLIYLYGLHHSNKFWEKPEIFDPARFQRANKVNHVPYSYIPFGAGPKGCLGGNYATLQMLIILQRLLKKFDLSLDTQETVISEPLIILKPKGNIYYNIKNKE